MGEPVQVDGATIMVESVTPIESFDWWCLGETYVPAEGRELFEVSVTVVNDGEDIIYPNGQLVGGSWVTWRAVDNSQMEFVFWSCTPEGLPNDGGLLKGESASFPLLVEGVAEPGWVEFTVSGTRRPEIVLLKPGLELVSG